MYIYIYIYTYIHTYMRSYICTQSHSSFVLLFRTYEARARIQRGGPPRKGGQSRREASCGDAAGEPILPLPPPKQDHKYKQKNNTQSIDQQYQYIKKTTVRKFSPRPGSGERLAAAATTTTTTTTTYYYYYYYYLLLLLLQLLLHTTTTTTTTYY